VAIRGRAVHFCGVSNIVEPYQKWRADKRKLTGKEFFPDQKQSHLLQYAVLRGGKVMSRRTLLAAAEGGPNEVPGGACFQVTPDGRLFVFYYVGGSDSSGKAVSENRLVELRPDGAVSPAIHVPLAHPMNTYFTATIRGGSAPSTILDVFGARAGAGNTMSCARIKLQ
jgi:hypothetical protein